MSDFDPRDPAHRPPKGRRLRLTMATKRFPFPSLIYVTEERPDNDEPWLRIHPDGIAEVEQDGQAVAVYQLCNHGKVKIDKSFHSARKPRRSRRK